MISKISTRRLDNPQFSSLTLHLRVMMLNTGMMQRRSAGNRHVLAKLSLPVDFFPGAIGISRGMPLAHVARRPISDSINRTSTPRQCRSHRNGPSLFIEL